ncbi:MAG: hypothetical protein R3E01_14445 [Pirellulaceae bacterium]|nr:hypothetical protein [Planctomycetales bacterium]
MSKNVILHTGAQVSGEHPRPTYWQYYVARQVRVLRISGIPELRIGAAHDPQVRGHPAFVTATICRKTV